MEHDPLGELLQKTASETHTALDEADFGVVPSFEPNSNKGGVIVGVIVALLLGVGGLLAILGSGGDSEVDTAVDPDLEAPDVALDDDAAPDDTVPDDTAPEDTVADDAPSEVITESSIPQPTIAPVVDLDVRQQIDVVQPLVGESYIDPAFGTTITRATNATSGEQIIPVQSPAAVWNADETLLLLYRTGAGTSGHEIIDAATFEIVRELSVVPTDIEHVFWHPTDADLLITTVDLDLVLVSVSTGSVSTVASYPECDSIDPGIATSGPSWNGERIALRCVTGDVTTVVNQPLDGSEPARLDVGQGQQGMVSADGELVIIETGSGFDIYDRELTELQSTIAWQASSPHMSLDAEGNPIIVSAAFEADFPGVIVTAPLDGSGDVNVTVGPDSGFPFPRSGTLTAANSWTAPGVLVAASPLPSGVIQGGEIETFDGEVVLADLRSTPPTVRRLAHTRNESAGPFSDAFVSVSPSGRFVAFSSDWGGASSDTYIIDLEPS